MKKTSAGRFHFCAFLLFLLAISVSAGFAQQSRLDTFKQRLARSRHDTTSSIFLARIAQFYLEQEKDDSAMHFASEGYALAAKHNFLMGMWVNLGAEGQIHQHRGNYQKSLRLLLDLLKLSEEKKESRVTTRILHNITELYIKLEDYDQAITYAKKNTPLIIESNVGGGWLASNLYAIGISFIHLHQADSAILYFQRAFALASSQISPKHPYDGGLNRILVGLGMANQALDNSDIALAYFNKATRNEEALNTGVLYFAYMKKAELWQKLDKTDSSTIYYEKALHAVSGNFVDQVLIYKALANIYLTKDPLKSVKYFALEQNLRDSLFTSDKLNAIRTLTYNEEERQKELASAEKEKAEEHKKNIEDAFIAIGIISFLIMFLLLSRSVIVNEKWIRFLGIIGLLMLFEFINLLLHPLIEKLTHHSSIYMLLIMVGIAALLVPLHHKIEKWVTGKVVEKNKQIRIAAARRTIEQLKERS